MDNDIQLRAVHLGTHSTENNNDGCCPRSEIAPWANARFPQTAPMHKLFGHSGVTTHLLVAPEARLPVRKCY